MINEQNCTLAVLGQEIFGSGLFSEKKLIIVHHLPSGTTNDTSYTSSLNEQIETMLTTQRDQLNPDNIIVFVSPKADKRKKFYKFIAEKCEIKTFSSPDIRTLPAFVASEFTTALSPEYASVKLNSELANLFIIRVGTDERRLAREAQKLADAISSGMDLNAETIELITVASPEANTFGITDALIGEKIDFFKTLDILHSSGEASQSVL